MPEEKSTSRKKGSLTTEIAELDAVLVRLLGKRTRLFGKAAGSRKSKKKSLVDPNQEKELWRNWRQAAELSGLDEKMMRQVFNVVNGLAYEQVERKQDWEFHLRPSPEPVRIEVDGPRDDLFCRMVLTLAAAAGNSMQLSPVILNDSLFELVKALNQAGGNVYWEQDRVFIRGGGTLDFDTKTIFCGQDPFNFSLLLFLAVGNPTVCRFSGGSRLKLVDLRALDGLVKALGARMINLVPGSHGLPLRLEAGGSLASSLSIPDGISLEIFQALLVALSANLKSGEQIWLEQQRDALQLQDLTRGAAALQVFGCDLEQPEAASFVLRSDLDSRPELVDPFLDPILSGFLLAMALISRGTTRLRGQFPEHLPEARAVLQLLDKAGLDLRREPGWIQGTFQNSPEQVLDIDAQGIAHFLPLALAVAITRRGQSLLRVDPGEDLDFACFLLDSLNCAYSLEAGHLTIHSGLNLQHCPPLKVKTSNAWWSLALGTIALRRPNLSIQNPGELTQLWPQFWSLLKGLPDPQKASSPKKTEAEKSGRQKRRKKVNLD